MDRTWGATATAAVAVAAIGLCGACSSGGSAKSSTATSARVAFAQGGPGLDFSLTGAVHGEGTTANAGALLSGAPPSGTVGEGAGLAFCGAQPRSAQRYGGSYAVATRFNLPAVVLVRLIVPNYTVPGTFPGTGSGTDGAVLQVSGELVHAASGQITITDAKNGMVAADFTTSKGAVHLSGSWRCP